MAESTLKISGKVYRLVEITENEPAAVQEAPKPEPVKFEPPTLSPEDRIEFNALFDEFVNFKPNEEHMKNYNLWSTIDQDYNSVHQRIKNNILIGDGLKCGYISNYLINVKNDYDKAEKYFRLAVELKYSRTIENYVRCFYLNHDFETSKKLLIKAINCDMATNDTVIPLLRSLLKIHGKGRADFICILNECDQSVKIVIDELQELEEQLNNTF